MARHKVISALQPVGFIATVSSGLQGLIWACFYLFALLTHYCVLSSDDVTPLTFKNYLTAYLQGASCSYSDNSAVFCISLVGPGQLALWFLLAVFFNLLLFTASIILYIVLLRCGKDVVFVFINTWICVSMITFVLDLILSSIFAIDLSRLERATCMMDRGLSSLMMTSLLLFSSRGFLLLIANFCFIVYFIIVSYRLHYKKQKHKEVDLTSNWPSTSDTSYDFDEGQTQRDDIVGIVNPLHDQNQNIYPVYTAKSRWPTLNRNFNTVPHQRSYCESNEYDKQPKQPKSDYFSPNNHNKINSVYSASANLNKNDNNRNDHSRDDVFHLDLQAPLNLNKTETRNSTVHDQIFEDSFNLGYNYNKNIIESRKNFSNHNRDRYESKTMPTHRAVPIPVPPPLPPLSGGSARRSNQPVARSAQHIDVEPDYSPVREQKQLNKTRPNRYTNHSDAEVNLRMTLHEQIKSRPPLRPVLQRMKVGSTGF